LISYEVAECLLNNSGQPFLDTGSQFKPGTSFAGMTMLATRNILSHSDESRNPGLFWSVHLPGVFEKFRCGL